MILFKQPTKSSFRYYLHLDLVDDFWSYPLSMLEVTLLAVLTTFGVGHLAFRTDVEYELDLFMVGSATS